MKKAAGAIWLIISEHEEEPDFGFSPDAEFPIINGEKGNVSFSFYASKATMQEIMS